MPDETKNPTGPGSPSSPNDELQNKDFQTVLKALLAAYQPILQRELSLAGDPAELSKAAAAGPPKCEDEITRANQIFGAFFTDDIAQKMLSAEARQLLGPVDQWAWCLRHIRCCIIFGWLVCRGPRNFRAFSYYLYQYWICVRQTLGTPVASPPSAQDRADFGVLVEELARAFKPFLTDELATVEFSSGIPDEVIGGRIDCREGLEEFCEIFERALTPRAAEALLGKQAFTSHSRVPSFWFCRCWCLCAICFGCCLARVRSLVELVWCLIYFFRCLERCLQPLTCQITDPHDCVEEQAFPIVNILRGVEIKGAASGIFCDHYELQWSQGGNPFQSLGIIYPGLAPQGACGVVNGTLGYLQTFPFVQPGPVDLRLCVFSNQQGAAPQCCTGGFTLQRNLVWIHGIEDVNAVDPFDPTSQPVDATGAKRSFGNAIRINGSAVVGGCQSLDLKRYTLSYIPDFVTDPANPGFVQFWEVDYLTPLQIDAGLNKIFEGWLTSFWRQPNFPPASCSPFFGDYLQEAYWSHLFPQSFPLTPNEAPCPPPPFWTTVPLPLANCQSGRFTLRLTTEDNGSNFKHNLRQVWFDNKQITPSHAHISQIAGVDPCATIDLRKFAPPGGDCSVPWSASLLGVAYDELIDILDSSHPSDNFGGYSLWIKKDGTPDPGVPVPIPGPGAPPWGPPFVGTTRVGNPGGDICPYTTLIPPPSDGILALLDMRRLDAVCNPAEPSLTLKRGECCGYVVTLLVWDNSICPLLSNGRHELRHTFPICICNHVGIES